MMFHICALGELLIDAVATADSSVHMIGNAGGAPANVLACAARMGLKTAVLAKAGDDFIGNWLKTTLDQAGICTEGLILDGGRNTTIAMVTLDDQGDRSFAFYRQGCADVSLRYDEVDLDIINAARIFHFGSVSMTAEPARTATLSAAKYARERGLLISYDPNIRLNLWQDEDAARRYIKEGLALCDIAKLADDECGFLFGGECVEENAALILKENPNIKVLFITCGARGSHVFTREGSAFAPGYQVQAIDTTGAGDAFMGAILYQVVEGGQALWTYSISQWREMAVFGNAVGALSVQKLGAIPAMPTREEAYGFLKSQTCCEVDWAKTSMELISR